MTLAPPASATRRIASSDWRAQASGHADRADELSAAHRERKRRGALHPVEDFLWTYYFVSPAQLRVWHPGAGVTLEQASDRHDWKYYRADVSDETAATLDLRAYFEKRGRTLHFIADLLAQTRDRTPRFGCFGLHEWAMVYRLPEGQQRHPYLSMRLSATETDEVVESMPLNCSHFDATRFFTEEARPRNELSPTRETQERDEQPACLHANMDLYKWATKLGPIVPGTLLLDTFVFARDIREIDMRASPYDVRAYRDANGEPLTPICIETPAGKRDYASLQRGIADRGNALRDRLLDAISVARQFL